MTRTIQIPDYSAAMPIAPNDKGCALAVERLERRADDRRSKEAAKAASRAASLKGAQAAAVALATGATDTGFESFDLPPALVFAPKLFGRGESRCESGGGRDRASAGDFIAFRLTDDDDAEVLIEKSRLAAAAREFRRRPCFVYVDAEGLHVRWNGGRGGLNFYAQRLGRAERYQARVTLVCFPVAPAATAARAAS